MALSAADAQDRVEQLIVLTENLTGRLAEEARAFEERRTLEAAPGLEETARMANLYRHECTRVKANPDLIAGADKASRDRLIEASRTFEQVLSRHAIGLEAARSLTEGLVQSIAQEVAAQRAPAAGYGATGGATAADTRAVTLNRKA